MGEDTHGGEVVATGSKKGGDMVLGSRHLVGIFVLLVVLFGVIFTLGYVLGRSQYDTQMRAAASTLPVRPDSNSAKPPAVAVGRSPADTPPVEPPSDWDFYHSAEPAKPAAPMPERPKPVSAVKPVIPDKPASARPVARRGSAPAPVAKSMNSPLIPHGATVLQVAALAHEADALALAQALQKKKFPAFVLNPPAGGADHFYRVQVGPYGDAPTANSARQKLEKQGFKSIVKR